MNRCCDTAAETEGGGEAKADSGSGQFVCVVCQKSFGNEQVMGEGVPCNLIILTTSADIFSLL